MSQKVLLLSEINCYIHCPALALCRSPVVAGLPARQTVIQWTLQAATEPLPKLAVLVQGFSCSAKKYTSKHEGVPNVIQQALAHGTPHRMRRLRIRRSDLKNVEFLATWQY